MSRRFAQSKIQSPSNHCDGPAFFRGFALSESGTGVHLRAVRAKLGKNRAHFTLCKHMIRSPMPVWPLPAICGRSSRTFSMALLLAAAALIHLAGPASGRLVAQTAAPRAAGQYYELQIWQIDDYENQEPVLEFLKRATLPALGRYGIDHVGVFRALEDENDHNVFVLVPFESIQQFEGLDDHLRQDQEYQEALQSFGQRELNEPLFARIETRLMRAFTGMPALELPAYSVGKQDRIFELRLYESHTQAHAQRKIRMFNDGEIQLMKDVNMAPVFFAETVAGPDLPNLVYMLSATDAEAHDRHWQAFLNDPRWPEMRDQPEFRDTVSRIRNWKLAPTDFSGI